MGRIFKVVTAFVGAAVLALAGCASPADEPDEQVMDAELRGEAKFSGRIVVPELTYSWWEPRAIPGHLALEINATAGGIFGVGAETQSTLGPLIMVGRDAYGAGGAILRIGADMNLYAAVDTTEDTELYCCLGSLNPVERGGVWDGASASIADVGTKGFYVVGRLVDVTEQDLRHGMALRADQIELGPGMSFGFTRRIQRGDRMITIEASAPPTLAESAPELASDPAAVQRALDGTR